MEKGSYGAGWVLGWGPAAPSLQKQEAQLPSRRKNFNYLSPQYYPSWDRAPRPLTFVGSALRFTGFRRYRGTEIPPYCVQPGAYMMKQSLHTGPVSGHEPSTNTRAT